ncbi:MAG: amidase [Bryobacterales bacterium]|nr:amidase [Bryobacterales bacterium]
MITRRDILLSLAATAPSSGATPTDLHWLSIAEAANLLRRRAVSPVDLTQACLRRVEALNPRLNAFITLTADTALTDARKAEKEIRTGRPRSPLHGIPIALKDLYDTAGVLTTAASAHYARRIPTEDAEVVRRLKSAGAIILGKLNMDEFAYNFTSETSSFGASRNPWDPARSPGGSSGGSAIAVATGMCFAALGSDTGGSIRLPASLCGIAGLKPTYGLVDAQGVVPLAWSLDHVGPMCRTARDTATVLSVLAGRTIAIPPRPAKTLRTGIPKGPWLQGIDTEVRTAFDAAVKLLGGSMEVDLPAHPRSQAIPDLPQTYITIIQTEAFAFHEEMVRQHPERYHAGTLQSIRNGSAIPAAEYARARREMDRLRMAVRTVFERVDLLLTPTAQAAAFELGKPAPLTYLRNTAPWNLFGLPTISIPCGFTKGGLPVGLQITGAPGRDDLVVQLAGAYQQASKWHLQRPPDAQSRR